MFIRQHDYDFNVTDTALNQIKNYILNIKKDSNLKFKIAIRGQGCKGFEYFFEFTDIISEYDLILAYSDSRDNLNIIILIDGLCYSILENATLDYKSSLLEKKFLIHNPNVKSTCSCGSSFSLE